MGNIYNMTSFTLRYPEAIVFTRGVLKIEEHYLIFLIIQRTINYLSSLYSFKQNHDYPEEYLPYRHIE